MKPLLFATIASFALVLTGCGGATTGDIPTIDLEAAIDNPQPFDLGEIAGKIEFLPLDNSTSESLIGNIRLLAESKTGFYIFDNNRSPIKVFDPTGKFLHTRGYIGRGPGELVSIMRMAVDWEGDKTYLFEMMGKAVAYDADGQAIGSLDSLSVLSVASFDGKLILMNQVHNVFAPDDVVPDSKCNLLTIYSPDMKLERHVEAPDKGAPRVGRNFFAGGSLLINTGNSLRVKEMRCDTVLNYSAGALEAAYILDYGRFTAPDAAFGANPTEPWRDNFHRVNNVMEGNRYLIVESMTNEIAPRDSKRNFLIFDRKKPAGGLSTLGPDGGAGLFVGGIAFTPSYIRDNRLVGYMQAIDIVDNAEAITDPQLKALAATLKEDSNPVIVVATLKK